MRFPPGITPDSFLRDHWQKAPLLCRGAFPGFESPLDGDELAGLACDADVESRIMVREEDRRWTLRDGPFEPADFAALPERDWTLLVQDVDKHLPDLAGMLDAFDFIPRWRIDDLMISWAADGGSVGPHVDRYDVFLLQAAGEREWQVAEAGDVPEGFTPAESWVLGPGDVLYLPPGVPHHGIARGPCMTWSIGFRAPSQAELLTDIADRMSERLDEAARYNDPDLTPDEAMDGRLSDAAVARARAHLDRVWAQAMQDLPRWFGETVTSPKAWLHCVPPQVLLSADALAERLRGGHGLVKDPRARMLWFRHAAGLFLCVDGTSTMVPASLEGLLALLCTQREFPAGALTRYLDDKEARRMIADLYNGGQLTDESGG